MSRHFTDQDEARWEDDRLNSYLRDRYRDDEGKHEPRVLNPWGRRKALDFARVCVFTEYHESENTEILRAR